MIFVTPWYCKSVVWKVKGNFMVARIELIRPVRWFVKSVEGAKWVAGRIKRALL